MRIHIEENRCSGCRLCQQICAIEHFGELNPKKSAIRIKARFPVPGLFLPEVCDQCGECESACPAGAIEIKNRAYAIDPSLCTSCEQCIEACPMGVMHSPARVDHPIKCDLCLKCTEVCNTGALVAIHEAPTGKDLVRCTDSGERPFLLN